MRPKVKALSVYAWGLVSFAVWVGIVSLALWLLPPVVFWPLATVWAVVSIRRTERRKVALLQLGGYIMTQTVQNLWIQRRLEQAIQGLDAEYAAVWFDQFLTIAAVQPMGDAWTQKQKRQADQAMGDN